MTDLAYRLCKEPLLADYFEETYFHSKHRSPTEVAEFLLNWWPRMKKNDFYPRPEFISALLDGRYSDI